MPDKILVVDDESEASRPLAARLTARGFEVRVASDGEEALKTADDFSPDLVISDVNMPILDGYGFCRRLRQKDGGRTPFVFLSAQTSVPSRVEGLRVGADDYLAKPYDFDELLLRVQNLLARVGRVKSGGAEPQSLLAGRLEQLPLHDLLQIMDMNQRSGTIHVESAMVSGSISFHAPLVAAASAGKHSGLKAAYRLFAVSEGSFRFDPDATRSGEGNVNRPINQVVMGALANLDEITRLRAQLEKKSKRVEVNLTPDFFRIRFDEKSLALLQLIHECGTVDAVIDASPEVDLEVLRNLAELSILGVVGFP